MEKYNIHQIENKTYEKYLLGQTNFDTTLPDTVKKQAILAVKDEYTFDFIDLADEHILHLAVRNIGHPQQSIQVQKFFIFTQKIFLTGAGLHG